MEAAGAAEMLAFERLSGGVDSQTTALIPLLSTSLV